MNIKVFNMSVHASWLTCDVRELFGTHGISIVLIGYAPLKSIVRGFTNKSLSSKNCECTSLFCECNACAIAGSNDKHIYGFSVLRVQITTTTVCNNYTIYVTIL